MGAGKGRCMRAGKGRCMRKKGRVGDPGKLEFDMGGHLDMLNGCWSGWKDRFEWEFRGQRWLAAGILWLVLYP